MIFICSLEEKQQPGIILLFVALNQICIYTSKTGREKEKEKRKEERHVDYSEIKNRFSFHFQSSIDQN